MHPMKFMISKSAVSRLLRVFSLAGLTFASLVLFASLASAEVCSTVTDMDASTRSALEHTALQFGDAVIRGDAVSLRQNAIASVASNFSGAEALVNDSKTAFAGGQASVRATYLLDATGSTQVLDHAQFLCGIWGIPQFVSFPLDSLPPAKYGLCLKIVNTPKGPYLRSFILQQAATASKLS